MKLDKNKDEPAPIKALKNLMIWNDDSDLLPPEFRTKQFRSLSESQRNHWIIAKINELRKEKKMPQARPMTKDEMVRAFLNHVATMAHYWGTLPDKDVAIGCEPRTPLDRVNGFAFSILSMIDGSSMGIPALNITAIVPNDDIEFFKSEGENWFDPTQPFNDDVAMHEIWGKYELDVNGSRKK